MTTPSFLFIALTLASLSTSQGELLRGTPDLAPHNTLTDQHRQLPYKKDLKELKRLNTQRQKNKKELNLEQKQWKGLGKDEKKALLEELKGEEVDWKEELGRGDMTKKEWKEMIKAMESNVDVGNGNGEDEDEPDEDQKDEEESDGDETDPLEQYSTLLNENINPNNLNAIWKDLSKEEKKQILALQKGKLLMNEEGKVVDNPDHNSDKLTKQEKKELMKQQEENDIKENSESSNNNGKEDGKKPNNAANDFVVVNTESEEEDEDPSTTTSTTTTTEKPKTTTTTTTFTTTKEPKDKDNQANDFVVTSSTTSTSTTAKTTTTTARENNEEDMTPNSHQVNQGNDFVIPNIPVTTTTTSTTTSTTVEDNTSTCKNCYSFSSSLQDLSTPFDSTDLEWTMSGSAWTTSNDCYNGDSCVASGINDALQWTDGEVVYSNLTLETDVKFDGGVLTFQLKGDLIMPNEAFFVTVDGEVASSRLESSAGWTEYGVVVDRGAHIITWTHVYNPLGLEALPQRALQGIQVDDLRLTPFDRSMDQGFEHPEDKLIMTSDGDATWQVDDAVANSGSQSILATTAAIAPSSGTSNVHFALYSKYGGLLKYKLTTSTTAPHDDFTVLLNGKPVECIFGVTRTLPSFEYREMSIPRGKVVVTFQHRKNPGNLSRSVLDSLGVVETDGETRLDDIEFKPHSQ